MAAAVVGIRRIGVAAGRSAGAASFQPAEKIAKPVAYFAGAEKRRDGRRRGSRFQRHSDRDDAALGFRDPERFLMESQGIEAVTYKTATGYVELIHPTDPGGAIARFLAKRGNTVHHMAMRVADLESSLSHLAGAGVRLIDDVPRIGAHGWRIAFIHPESCAGILIELVQDESADAR